MLDPAASLPIHAPSLPASTGSPARTRGSVSVQPVSEQPARPVVLGDLPADIVRQIGARVGSPRDLLNFAVAAREVRTSLATTPEYRRAQRLSAFLNALLARRGPTVKALADNRALGRQAARLSNVPISAARRQDDAFAGPAAAVAIGDFRAIEVGEARSRRAVELLTQGYHFGPDAQIELWLATRTSAVERSAEQAVIDNIGKFSPAVQDALLTLLSDQIPMTQPDVLQRLALQIPALDRFRQKKVVTLLASAPASVRRDILTSMASVLHLMPKPVQRSWFAQAYGAQADEMARPMFSGLLPKLIEIGDADYTELYSALTRNVSAEKSVRRNLTDRDAA